MTSTIPCPTPVAILMAAYNAEKYIEVQIDSVIAQTSSEWTLYIRNDGSKDGTQSIIDSYASRYPEKIIQIDKGGENLGCNKNFYRLLETVEADYYMFADSDDYWMPNKVERNLEQIRKREQEFPDIPILVHNDMMVCDAELNVIHDSLWQFEKLHPEKFNTFGMLLVSPNVGGSTSIFNHISKKYIFPVPKDNRIFFDHWISLSIAKYGQICVDRFISKKYRQHGNQECGLNKDRFSFKSIIRRTNQDSKIFKTIGVPRSKFYLLKLLRIIRSL